MGNRMNIQKSNLMLQFYGVLRWSLLRHKFYLPVFTIVQMLLAVAIVYGFALMTPVIDNESAIYFSSGALTLGLIAVGCVLAPQIVCESKQNGILQYQRTLPVPRHLIVLADVLIWGMASLPGIIMSLVAGIIRFDIDLNITLYDVFILAIILICLILIGFCIAYLFEPNMTSLITQVIMIVTLLFSPILYPASRLPEWITPIYNAFPFVPISNLIRSTIFDLQQMEYSNLMIVIFWGIFSFVVSLKIISRKD
ncbi:MAG: ABC transporter permease [Eubacteriales bacterium]